MRLRGIILVWAMWCIDTGRWPYPDYAPEGVRRIVAERECRPSNGIGEGRCPFGTEDRTCVASVDRRGHLHERWSCCVARTW